MKRNDSNNNGNPDKEGIRLQSFIAKSGICSRRKAEQLVRDGQISINGVKVDNPAARVMDEDVVMYKNRLIEPLQHVYIILNKPKGYVCSNSDPHADLFARDLIDIPEHDSLFHVGRLDKDSSGIIFYTNDGDFANRVIHPSQQIEKEYIVRTREKLESSKLQQAIRGCRIEGKNYKIERFKIINNRMASLILIEGKNREIRRIMEFLDYRLVSLHRIRIGPIELGKLASGSFRRLKRNERNKLLQAGENQT